MKTRLPKPCPPSAFHSRSGSAVVIFLALLAIMLVLVAANGRTLLLLKKDLRLIEQRQVQRLERSQTNAVSQAPTPASTPVTPP
jgi:hypothetical protein